MLRAGRCYIFCRNHGKKLYLKATHDVRRYVTWHYQTSQISCIGSSCLRSTQRGAHSSHGNVMPFPLPPPHWTGLSMWARNLHPTLCADPAHLWCLTMGQNGLNGQEKRIRRFPDTWCRLPQDMFVRVRCQADILNLSRERSFTTSLQWVATVWGVLERNSNIPAQSSPSLDYLCAQSVRSKET